VKVELPDIAEESKRKRKEAMFGLFVVFCYRVRRATSMLTTTLLFNVDKLPFFHFQHDQPPQCAVTSKGLRKQGTIVLQCFD
jgi:hypothetical protein